MIATIFALQIALLIAVGWSNRFQMGPDSIAYLRIAEYYATLRTDLMVCGYWGPMLSWIIAPLLPLVSEPLLAARLAMGLSAVVFLAGCVAVFRRLELPPLAQALGAGVSAVMSVRYSVSGVSPDLLVCGLMCLAGSRLLAPDWPAQRRGQALAGAVFGLAYLAKAVALPIFVVMTVAVAALRAACGPGPARRLPGAMAVTGLAFALTAGPWIAVLSVKYGGLTFSTTARIAHTVVGPHDVERQHPFGLTIAAPEEGRLTWWEDPTGMPYRHWSPFASIAYAKHQLRIVGKNATLIAGYLSSFDWLHLGLLAAAAGLLLHAPWRHNLAEQRWRWAGIAVLAVGVVYLPVYALGPRYYFAAFPFLFAAAVGLAREITRAEPGAGSPAGPIGLGIVVASFALPSMTALPELLGRGGPEPTSRVLARGLAAKGLDGPVVGDTMEGLMTAFFLGQPFHGGFPSAGPQEYLASGADLVVTVRSFPVVDALDGTPELESLDATLFGGPQEAAAFPLKAYRRVRARAAAAE